MAKGKIIINDFGGIGSKNIYYLEGMHPDNMSGQSVLSPGYKISNRLSEESANFDGCCDMVKIDHEERDQYITWNGSSMYSYDFSFAPDNIGLIHTYNLQGSGTNQVIIGSSNGSSIIRTEEGHVLYTTANHLGFGYKGTCTSNGTTTTLVDNTADFTDITDVTDGSTNTKKVYNFTKREEYLVSSVTTDTITFVSAADTAPEDGDVYMLFIDGKWKFNTQSNPDLQFGGQITPLSWFRRIILWEDSYYIANGNYISKLSLDLTTWENEHLLLPARTQCLELSYNSSKILISGDVDDRGILLLWDGRIDGGFLNKLEIDSATNAVTSYESGFIFNIGAKLYYTDGYSYSEFATVPHIQKGTRDFITDKLNNIKTSFGVIYMLANVNNGLTSIKNGLLIFDKNNGFTQIPFKNNDSYGYANAGSGLYFFRDGSVNDNFVSYSSGAESTPDEINIGGINTSEPSRKSVIFNFKLPEKMNISLIELNVGHTFKQYGYGNATAYYNDITVSSCGGKYTFWRYGQVKGGVQSTTTKIYNANGAYSQSHVGEEIIMLEGNAGGDRSFITAIENAGTSDEELTISPALSDTINTLDTPSFNILPLKKCATKRVYSGDNSGYLIFPSKETGLVDNFFVEIVFEGDLDLDLLSVTIS